MRGKFVDLSGEKYHRLAVVQLGPRDRNGKLQRECICDCGKLCAVPSSHLTSGSTKSCGCLRTEVNSALQTTHGQANSPSYRVWGDMLTRCTNKKSNRYHKYGGRGITVCERWKSFENFYADMGDKPSPQHSIDRIDNDKNYCPENCRWATRKEQCSNRTTSRLIVCHGETLSLAQWSEKIGMSSSSIAYRIKSGWEIERALTEPIRKMQKSPRSS